MQIKCVCLLLVLLVNWSQMKPAIGPFLCVRLNFVCCRLLNNATSGAWGSDVACVCAVCCQVRGFPAELLYFNTVAAGWQKISISDRCCSSELSIHQSNLKKIYSAVFNIIINVFWAANQNIRMISEGSCDRRNDAKNSALTSQE